MSLSRNGLLAAAAFLTLATAAVQAAPVTYKIDNAHSQVGFSIRHIFTKVYGKFDKFEGTIEYNADKPEDSKVSVTIQAASIDTNNERRDNDLRGESFFEVEKIPTLTFASSKVTVTKEGALTVAGDLSMHGITKPVVLKGTILGADPNVAGFEASTTLNRKDYGIIWNKTLDNGNLMLSDDVTVTLTIEAHKPRPMPAGDKAPPPAPEKKS